MFTFGIGGEIALSNLSTRTCGTTEKGFRHVEPDKECRRQRRKLKGRWISASSYRNFGISMEEEETPDSRLHPVTSKKINLMKKDVLASKKSKEAEKQLKTIALQRPCSVQLERIKIQNLSSQISSIFGQHLQQRSTPTKKETIKDLVRMIKSEPEENTNKTAAPGIRMLLEKTHRRRCDFLFSICLSS